MLLSPPGKGDDSQPGCRPAGEAAPGSEVARGRSRGMSVCGTGDDRAPLDARELRRALGSFATGVTIVTTFTRERGAVGLTVNSFSSVSLDPPLVLWSLSRRSPSLAVFEAARHFAINVLAAGQQQLSNRFASPIPEKFSGVGWSAGLDGVPLLDGCTATFECRARYQLDGGDHVIFIGEVERFARCSKEPLLFLGGRYYRAEPVDRSARRGAG